MAVGKKEKTDVKYDREATLKLYNKEYNLTVYGDKTVPNRRDVFVPKINKVLPKMVKVNWMGNTYRAGLSFRYGSKGAKIPVYTWKV